ncbi:PREDICTED: protein phosphatase 1 regulatory subunit 37-like [Ceratosolen solmsi marchali]|uniref:Protein phosphatase 1 regulatory subunit 37-like n=1 Tax=Ceratosolen solmsi marchali TaxID=326594 RepID=A0AAJ7DVL0_9HYME|nr:PREDICTED: protein phosphatase 1 regulatory subunit 37-like [Ceratosolen solmsi marchali]
MLRKTESLKRLDATNVHLNEEFMTILIRGLRYAYLIILKLDSCKLSGRLLELLVIALKFNMALRQLYLCDNGLHGSDCIQIETLLKFNSRLAFLDLSNNLIGDEGLYYVINGLTHQLHFGKNSKSKKGLESLILWNNKMTRCSATHINAAIKRSKTLKCLNIGSNTLMDDVIMDITDSLMENKVLLRLELQSTEITCYGASELARVLKVNNFIKILDLRNNPIYKLGLLSLTEAVKTNENVTEIIVDEKSKIKISNKIKIKYSELVKQLQSLCERNKELQKEKESASCNACGTDADEESDEKDDSIFGEDDFEELEEPQEELPSQYKRYMTWKI